MLDLVFILSKLTFHTMHDGIDRAHQIRAAIGCHKIVFVLRGYLQIHSRLAPRVPNQW